MALVLFRKVPYYLLHTYKLPTLSKCLLPSQCDASFVLAPTIFRKPVHRLRDLSMICLSVYYKVFFIVIELVKRSVTDM
jgi:hypothetical protein